MADIKESSPSIRLACNGAGQGEVNGALNSPSVRLALSNGPAERNEEGGLVKHENVGESRPALLVSYVYLKPFLINKPRYDYRDWALDSGAFSAHNSGTEISLRDYIYTCKTLMERDPTLTEVFSLDVIGDWRNSLKNCERMWREGVEAIPCFHADEPESVLMGMARDYPKIALGGVALKHQSKKLAWARQCFARVWPKKIHGFAFGSEESLMALPWHSVDATSWEIRPCKFGSWQTFGNLSVRGSNQNLRCEVEWYLDLERRARRKWAKEMAELQSAGHPSVRLAIEANANKGRHDCLEQKP